jgi:dTDP-4-amino-4,6-dideoxygalactose transaminase
VRGVLESGALTMGPKVAELEGLVAAACGVEHAVAVSNGTAALHLAVLALGIGAGDEVIVPAYTFPATASVVRLAGATPVLVDVDPATFNLDLGKVYDAVTPRTKAVLAVHLFGRPLDWEALQSAVPPDVLLLEDAAGALGAKWRGMPCGGLGQAGCLSFHPRKVVTTGEGGAVTTSDVELAASIRRLRNHGLDAASHGGVGGADIVEPSTNYRLSDILCAIGIPQLHRLDELLAERTRIAAGYTERLADIVDVPGADEGDTHGWQAYVIGLDRRREALETLRAEGIEVQIGTYALHHLTAYRDQGPFSGADAAFERALALPLHSRLSDSDLDRVAEGIRRFA